MTRRNRKSERLPIISQETAHTVAKFALNVVEARIAQVVLRRLATARPSGRQHGLPDQIIVGPQPEHS
ncbi:MAG TPA: hypothetical protein VLB73_02615 [Patescibacteria group bacterium]|nr:hypothetical protein [Patescibacteria group bacterium]